MYHSVMRGEDGYSLESRESPAELTQLAQDSRRKLVVTIQNEEKAKKLLEKLQSRGNR